MPRARESLVYVIKIKAQASTLDETSSPMSTEVANVQINYHAAHYVHPRMTMADI